jgi:hypothetical protein
MKNLENFGTNPNIESTQTKKEDFTLRISDKMG